MIFFLRPNYLVDDTCNPLVCSLLLLLALCFRHTSSLRYQPALSA